MHQPFQSLSRVLILGLLAFLLACTSSSHKTPAQHHNIPYRDTLSPTSPSIPCRDSLPGSNYRHSVSFWEFAGWVIENWGKDH